MNRSRLLMLVVAASLFLAFATGLFGLMQPTPTLASGGVTNPQPDAFSAEPEGLSPAAVETDAGAALRLPVNQQAGDAGLLTRPALTVTMTSLIRRGGWLQPGEDVTRTAATAGPFAADQNEIVNAARASGTQGIGPATATELEAQAEPINFSVFKNAFPTSVLESGGLVTFSVEIINFNQTVSVTIDQLVDDIHGDLNGRGSCSVPQDIVAGGNYACDFTETVSGDFGVPEIDTVTAHGVDADGNMLTKFANATVNFLNVPSSITITKTANPSSIPEPGAIVDFTVTVDNTSPGDSVTLDELVDDVHGNLDGRGDCTLPQTMPRMTTYSCTYTATVSGNAGDTITSTTTVTATDDDNVELSASDGATVTLFDVNPTINVTKSANPTVVNEPGGSVNFTVRVQNTSPGDAVTLNSLNDDKHGNLDGQGNCSVPQSISIGGTYQCNYTVIVSGSEGSSQTSTVTAQVSDDEGNNTQASGGATVNIGATLPIYLPFIGFAGFTELSVVNRTGAAITFTVVGTSVIDCPVPPNDPSNPTACGSFLAGTYTVKAVTSVCGTGFDVETYGPGPEVSTVRCQ